MTVVSAYISILVFIALIVTFVLIFIRVYRLTRKLDDQSIELFNIRFSVINESLKETKRHSLIFYWKPLNLLRWVLTLIFLVTLKDTPSFQILTLLILSVLQQALIICYLPYDTKEINLLSLYNELAVSVYLYLGLLLTDNLDADFTDQERITELRLQIAWVLASILISTIFINFMVTFKNIAVSVFRYLREVKRRNYVQVRVRLIDKDYCIVERDIRI